MAWVSGTGGFGVWFGFGVCCLGFLLGSGWFASVFRSGVLAFLGDFWWVLWLGWVGYWILGSCRGVV